MNVLTSLGILFLSLLILIFLMLTPGVFAIFLHYASGKYSSKKVDSLCLFFILGVEALVAVIFISINFILQILSLTGIAHKNNVLTWIIVGIILALSCTTFLFYFRKGNGTKLFITRKTADNFILKAKLTKTRSDSFILGFIAGIPELIFTLPLYIIITVELAQISLTALPCPLIILLLIIGIIAPLIIVYGHFKSGNNLATIQRFRTKNKPFFRFFISLLYLLLAISIISFRIFT